MKDPEDEEEEQLVPNAHRHRGWRYVCNEIWSPFIWFQMLGKELGWSFVAGVIIVYGASQGVGGALAKVVVGYYWKDVQLQEPSAMQFYRGVTWIPWDVKPLWGFLTDTLPILGYHRRPYFILAGFLGLGSSLLLVSARKLQAGAALSLFVAGSASAAIADVTLDAIAAKKSREQPTVAADIQSLCSSCMSLGNLLGFSIAGLAVSLLGAQGALILLAVPPILFLTLGFLIHETPLNWHQRQRGEVNKKFGETRKKMMETIRCPLVWKPAIYMFFSWAMSPDITEGKFFFYTDPVNGLGFSQEFIGIIYAFGSMGSLLGVILYHRLLKEYPFRSLLLWAQLLLSASGLLDLMLITRVNKRVHIPDYVFVVVDESLSRGITRLKWVPLLVLCSKLCPSEIEGTFFALLMSIDGIGLLFASSAGGVLLKVLEVRHSDFRNLWLAVVIRCILMLFPLLLLTLLPATNASTGILPSDLSHKHTRGVHDTDNEDVELIAVHKENI